MIQAGGRPLTIRESPFDDLALRLSSSPTMGSFLQKPTLENCLQWLPSELLEISQINPEHIATIFNLSLTQPLSKISAKLLMPSLKILPVQCILVQTHAAVQIC